MEKQVSNKRIYIIGVLLILFGSSVFLYNYVNEKIDVAYEMMNEQLFANSTLVPKEKVTEAEIVPSTEEEPTGENNNNGSSETIESYYIGYIEIPKINVYRGFVDIDSAANNVRINVQILKPSNYPSSNAGNFILASHSGNGYNAYFKDLYQLVNGDLAYVYYNNQKYTYQITNIYLQPKVGTLSIYRDKSKSTLTLITCTKDDESTQTVYILDLVSVE